MDWIKWRDEIHQNAVEHGWWGECPPPAVRDEGGNEPNEAGSADAERTGDHAELRKEDRTAAEIVCLFHSELSEALEEYRSDAPMVYGLVIDGEEAAVPRIETDMEEIRRLGLKPEGAAVELADAVIRILDWFGACEFDDLPMLDNGLNSLDPDELGWELPRLLAECHQIIADAWSCVTIDNDDISSAVIYFLDWLSAKGYDLERIMELKHNYNKSRPYRHGGKRI